MVRSGVDYTERSSQTPESWRSIEGWPYEASSRGRIRRAIDAEPRPGTRPGRILKPWWGGGNQEEHGGGGPYLYVDLNDLGRRKQVLVHRVVCECFHGPPPFEGAQCDHLDGDREHNAPFNLEWVDHVENQRRRDAFEPSPLEVPAAWT